MENRPTERQRHGEIEKQRDKEVDRKTGRNNLSCTHASGKTYRIPE
jgi:hypothetical protein